ncbi:TIGR04500 family putative peptide maturation system protein [Streptomyces sp. NPDC020996]|uniref:TIGR04500 family putative peptide maturation system protein n=1 Tax=Streptomyces sp. NPDC020996 TaxID=3154791 RepID=UPI0033D3117A
MTPAPASTVPAASAPPTPAPALSFEAALAEAVTLLRALPRRRESLPGARRTAEHWAADVRRRGGPAAVLVVDEPPGTPLVDYDLLIDHPDGGCVAVNHQAEDGLPWAVDHSTHWAAGRVLTVDGLHSVSIPAALYVLRAAGLPDRTLHDQLVDHVLLLADAHADPQPASPAEVQAATDDFRRRLGLHNRDALFAWLDSLGLTRAAFEQQMTEEALVARLRRRIAETQAHDHLRTHERDFEHVHAVWATARQAALLAPLAEAGSAEEFAVFARAAADAGAPLRVTAGTSLPDGLPLPLRDLAAGTLVPRPVRHDGELLVGAVLSRRPAPHDDDTLAAAGRAAVAAWLAERRSRAQITWHWL